MLFIKFFFGIKSHVGQFPKNRRLINIMDVPVWTSSGKSGTELIAYTQKAALEVTVANFSFHGVGGV